MGAFLAVFTASYCVAPLVRAEAAPPPEAGRSARDAAAALERETGGAAHVDVDPRDGLARFVGTRRSAPIATTGRTVRDRARSFVADHGAVFGVEDPADLSVSRSTGRSVRFQQTHGGIPVLGGELAVRLDDQGGVLAAGGEVSTGLDVATLPAVTAATARATALDATAKAHGQRGTVTRSPERWIYDPALLGGPNPGPARLVWRVEVAADEPTPFRDLVLVDAATGGVALRIEQLAEGKVRSVCDRNNVVTTSDACTAPYVRTEGQAATGNTDVDRAYDYAGDTYDYYWSKFGRDSLDGAGLGLKSTVRYCPDSSHCPYQNAYWNGTQMVYGAGFAAADDVVGHELTHGVTEFENSLFYYYQSGAINESLSDVFGELIDQQNGSGTDTPAVRWLLGEDLPGIGAIRNMADPPAFGDPDRMGSPLYATASTDEGGVHTNSGVNNKAAALMTDGGTFNGQTVTGLGADKVGRIYYETSTNLLTSAADYHDLAAALPQGCANLVGTAGITAADCGEVAKVVAATEMDQDPPAAASATEAPVCPAGKQPVTYFADDLENPASGNWVAAKTGTYQPWAYPQNPNLFSGFNATYATSGVTNIFGADPSVTTNATFARTAGVVPPVGKTTYLRFRHAFGMEKNYDGGRVEYSTNNGSTWTDAGSLFTDNGYNGTASALGGAAFSGQSHGYYSSRLNLTSLAGQSVRFRFHIASDSSVGEYGWWIDDITVYSCSAPPVADAGPDQAVAKGAAFTLDGSGSSDPDGDPITYSWLQLSGTPAVIVDPTEKYASVNPVAADSKLVFQLTVTDSYGLTHTDTVQVTVGHPK